MLTEEEPDAGKLLRKCRLLATEGVLIIHPKGKGATRVGERRLVVNGNLFLRWILSVVKELASVNLLGDYPRSYLIVQNSREIIITKIM